jgi:hypothetical protein
MSVVMEILVLKKQHEPVWQWWRRCQADAAGQWNQAAQQ